MPITIYPDRGGLGRGISKVDPSGNVQFPAAVHGVFIPSGVPPLPDAIVAAIRGRRAKGGSPNEPNASAPSADIPAIAYSASAPTSTHPVTLYPAGVQIPGDATDAQKLAMMGWIHGFSPRLRNYAQGEFLRLQSSLYNTAGQGSGGTDTVVDPGVTWGIDAAVSTWTFGFYGASFAFPVKSVGYKFDICVNDEMVNASSVTGGHVSAKSDGCGYVTDADGFVTLTFPSSAFRRIRLRFSSIYAPSRMMFPRLSTVVKSPSVPTWIHIGDSFSANGPQTSSAPTVQEEGRCITSYLQEIIAGSANIINISAGGTSYSHAAQVFPESVKPYTTSYRPSFRKMFQLVGRGIPNVGVVSILGGYNDIANNAHILPGFSANIKALISEIQAEYPDALIVVVGTNCAAIWVGDGKAVAAENTIKSSVSGMRAKMVELQTAPIPFLTGSGSDGAPAGDGNADYMMYLDHPTPMATPIWASKIVDALI